MANGARRSFLSVGILSLTAAVVTAAVLWLLGFVKMFGDGYNPGDDERPPIIVSSGGSITVEALAHIKGTPRGAFQNTTGYAFEHTDTDGTIYKSTKKFTLRVLGSSCTTTDPFLIGKSKQFYDIKNVTSAAITYNSAQQITVDINAGNLRLTFPEMPRANGFGYALEVGEPKIYLTSVAAGGESCLFNSLSHTSAEAILISQKH